MIQILQTAIKQKERKIIDVGPDFKEIKNLDFDSIIPKNARNLEITYKQNRDGRYLLSIDYISKLEVIKEGDPHGREFKNRNERMDKN
ncbi:MAG: hypothetical protein EOL97_13570 [Spirochaetia bacterium]|jgi:hypothetical protein|nr:hypothetical protein [Tissierellia bacterium]NCD07141.1 hypothetical protein [Spirochaetia bacterium]